MSTPPWLTLIASEIGVAPSREEPASPGLERLAGRGSVARRWVRTDAKSSLQPWQRGLLDVLGIAPDSVGSAAVSMSGHDGYWFAAEPVHFAAGLDRLTFLTLTEEARVTDAERSELFETLSSSFTSGDFVLQAAGGEWFVRAARPLQVVTSTPEAASSNELQSVMPRGADSPVVRRVMTEMQMLLHEHPVNEARARRGLPAINAVWLWGSSVPLESSMSSEFPAAFGSRAFLHGLYRRSDQSVGELPQNPEVLLQSIARAPRAIAVVPEADLESFDSHWLSPLSAALAQGRLSRLDIILDEWHIDVRRGDLRRFWRRALPLSQWGSQR
ncbi:hypothetical protein [Povalibacter sp.]|uniref:hypothetical protein n=1 Tax=Povalibacter sp. TaxID=1962978 RepID=UPI002F3FD579